ncbi:MAG: DUF4990 domain-containing protein [Niabella sp.]|nr:DUF4990 domain-containing protein [Niabella sp.]
MRTERLSKPFGFLSCLLILLLGSACAKKEQSFAKPALTAVVAEKLVAASTALHTYYVSATGSDQNPGTLDLPFLTVQRAQTAAVPGDDIYIRGGRYVMQEAQIARTESLYSIVTYLNKNGTADARIRYLAYPGEIPVFDFSNVKPAGHRVTAFLVTGSYITIKGIEVTGVQVTITTHTQSECFRNEGSYNVYEALRMHDGMGIGFYLTKGGNNLVLNCDAFNNWDNVSEDRLGGNVDGFGCHPNRAGRGYTGNVLRGCRAWFNSDDGYDLINAFEAVTIENCWSFYNGYSISFKKLGNGLGFKAGGYGLDPSTYPTEVPRHMVRFCLAINNKTAGFYANHHPGGITWINNTAYKNPVNYNMLCRVGATDVPGFGHIMYNNMGYKAKSVEVNNLDTAQCTTKRNYFEIAEFAATDADFTSLDENLLTQARNADGTLPVNDFMRLTPRSRLIDWGRRLEYPYQGTHPDLGCFEYGIPGSPIASGPVTQ